MIAKSVDYTAEVTLRVPPPLDKPMQIGAEDGMLTVKDGDQLIASCREGQIDFTAPLPPSKAEVAAAEKRFVWFHNHPFSTCFVCGPDRGVNDGLRIFAGATETKDMVAALWTPDPTLDDGAGKVSVEFIWAALDCPGAFAVITGSKPMLLGRMTAQINRSIKIGEKCTVIAWAKGHDGRKHFSGTAVYSESNELCAVGHAIWFDF